MPVASVRPATVDDELARLAGLRFMPSDLTGHREVLASVDLAVLADAVGHALRECREFPTPSELLGFVDQARARHAASAPLVVREREIAPVTIPVPHTDRTVTVTREYAPECDVCLDNGWQPLWCGPRNTVPYNLQQRGVLANNCGRRHNHTPHEFMVACFCRATNATYQRKREQECASARKRTEKGTN